MAKEQPIRPTLDSLRAGERNALVLAGGGSRGAYQVGVWQALRELDIPIHLVTGSSVGALNGALIVQDDFETAVSLWQNLSSRDILPHDPPEPEPGSLDTTRQTKVSLSDFLRQAAGSGGADVSPLEGIIRLLVDEERFRASPVAFGMMTVEWPRMRSIPLGKEDIPRGQLAEYLLASAACFPALQAAEIDGVRYIDGGYSDNMPVNLALEMGAGQVIAVDLESIGVSRRLRSQDIPLLPIRSHWNLGPFLYFDRELARRNMALGWADTMKALGRLEGFAYTFRPGELRANGLRLYRAYRELFRNTGSGNRLLDGLLRQGLLREVSRRKDLGRRLGLSEVIASCGEFCGEAFGLDPLPVYRFEEFNRSLTELFRADLEHASKEGLPSLKESGPGDILSFLRGLDQRGIIRSLANLLVSPGEDPSREAALSLASLALRDEFLAALYLACLLLEESGPETREA